MPATKRGQRPFWAPTRSQPGPPPDGEDADDEGPAQPRVYIGNAARAIDEIHLNTVCNKVIAIPEGEMHSHAQLALDMSPARHIEHHSDYD